MSNIIEHPMRGWKILRLTKKGTIKSNRGNCTWWIGEWQKIRRKLRMCCTGLHFSTTVRSAIYYGEIEVAKYCAHKNNYEIHAPQHFILAKIETRGKVLKEPLSLYNSIRRKYCSAQMRIVKAYSIFCEEITILDQVDTNHCSPARDLLDITSKL